jgi:hypothetical protein
MKKILMSALAGFAFAVAGTALAAEKAEADTSKATTYVAEMTGVT